LSIVPAFVLTEKQREKLKQPLGELVRGLPQDCNLVLKKVIEEEEPIRLVLVGDAVSRLAIESGIKPNVIVIDKRERRQEARSFDHRAIHRYWACNPAGTIDLRAWDTVEEAMRKSNGLVLVDGEEDLLTLVAILAAPSGSLVVYGQPDQGIVLVRVSVQKKREIEETIERMERRS